MALMNDQWGGHRLRVAMVEARMTQQDLADGTGVALQTVGRHMRGDTPITVQQLIAYARVLGVDPASLLPRLDSNQQPVGIQTGPREDSLVGVA